VIASFLSSENQRGESIIRRDKPPMLTQSQSLAQQSQPSDQKKGKFPTRRFALFPHASTRLLDDKMSSSPTADSPRPRAKCPNLAWAPIPIRQANYSQRLRRRSIGPIRLMRILDSVSDCVHISCVAAQNYLSQESQPRRHNIWSARSFLDALIHLGWRVLH
jgi:hypothetical protein